MCQVDVLFQYLRVYENFILLIIFMQQQKYTKNKNSGYSHVYTKNEASPSDNFFFPEMQTTNREKFFNYFRMILKLFEELLAFVGLRICKTRIRRIKK